MDKKSQPRQWGAHPYSPQPLPLQPTQLGIPTLPVSGELTQGGGIKISHPHLTEEEQACSPLGTGPQLTESRGTEPWLPRGMKCARGPSREPEHRSLTQRLWPLPTELLAPTTHHQLSEKLRASLLLYIYSLEQRQQSVGYHSQEVCEGP